MSLPRLQTVQHRWSERQYPARPNQIALYHLGFLLPSGSRAARTANLRPAEEKAGRGTRGKARARGAKRPHGPGPASPPPRAPRVRGSRQAATCLRLVKRPGHAHCPSTPLGPGWERTEATRDPMYRKWANTPSAAKPSAQGPEEDLHPRESSDKPPQAARALGDAACQSPDGGGPGRTQLAKHGKARVPLASFPAPTSPPQPESPPHLAAPYLTGEGGEQEGKCLRFPPRPVLVQELGLPE